MNESERCDSLGPPNATILVSAAHCNFICKDGEQPVETCCCRDANLKTSCKQVKSSNYYGGIDFSMNTYVIGLSDKSSLHCNLAFSLESRIC